MNKEIDLQAIRDLEQQINAIPFAQVSGLGSTVYLPLVIMYKEREGISVSMNLRQKLAVHVNSFLLKYGFRNSQTSIDPTLKDYENNKLLNVYLAGTTAIHAFELIRLVASRDNYQHLIFCPPPIDENIRDKDLLHIFSNNFFCSNDFKEWQTNYREVKTAWRNILSTFVKEQSLTFSEFKWLENVLLIQSQRFISFKNIFQRIKPQNVITDFDRNPINIPAVLAANYLNVNTYTFIHGSTYPPDNYLPFLAKFVFCWGELHKLQFSNLGIEEHRLLISGNQKIHRDVLLDKESIKHYKGLSQDRIVTFASNNIPKDLRIKLLESFCRSFSTLNEKEIKGIISLHPREKKKDYKSLIENYPGITFASKDDFSNKEIFSISDLIICHNSVFATDAILHGIPIAILDTVDYPIGIGKVLVKNGFPLLKSSRDLTNLLKMILKNPNILVEIKKKTIDFSKSYANTTGEETVNIILKCLN